MVIGTPVLLNPNSHENIDKILSKLKTNLRIQKLFSTAYNVSYDFSV